MNVSDETALVMPNGQAYSPIDVANYLSEQTNPSFSLLAENQVAFDLHDFFPTVVLKTKI